MDVKMAKQEPRRGPPTPVTIWQWQKEFETLLELYRRLEPLNVLEVGTYHGGTLYHWLQNASPRFTSTITSVDSYAVGVDNRHLYAEWTPEWMELTVLEGDSHDPKTVEAVRALGPYDWVFIDAGHYLPEVTQDWESYRPMVREGGVLCFHDIVSHPAWPSIEVGQLWEKIKQVEKTLEIVDDWEGECGGIGVVLL